MFRHDIAWILPSIVLLIFQIKVLWKRLPVFHDQDTEIAGKYTDFEFIWYRNIKYFLYLVCLGQLFFRLYELASDQRTLIALRIGGYFLLLSGVVISYSATRTLGAHWTGMMAYRIKKGQTLKTDGIYGLIRHPIYLSVILECVAYELIVNSWLFLPFLIISSLIFSKHIHNEDMLLEKKFGEEFRRYKKQVKAFIPLLY